VNHKYVLKFRERTERTVLLKDLKF